MDFRKCKEYAWVQKDQREITIDVDRIEYFYFVEHSIQGDRNTKVVCFHFYSGAKVEIIFDSVAEQICDKLNQLQN